MSVVGFAERFNIAKLFQAQGKAVAKQVEKSGLLYVTAAHDTNEQKGGNVLCLYSGILLSLRKTLAI